MNSTNTSDYKQALKYLFFSSITSSYMIKKGVKTVCNTAFKTQGISLFIFGLYTLINTGTALYLTQIKKEDISNIIKNKNKQENTFIVKLLQTIFTSFFTLPELMAPPQKGVTPQKRSHP